MHLIINMNVASGKCNELRIPILAHVVCPSDNAAEMPASYNAARYLFEQQCPAGASVVDVAGIRETGKLKCAWIVNYVRRNGFDHISQEELAREIRNSKPNNTSIVKQMKQYRPSLNVTYSIDCGCPVSPSAGRFTNSNVSFIKKFDTVDDIKVNLDNLKVEANE